MEDHKPGFVSHVLSHQPGMCTIQVATTRRMLMKRRRPPRPKRAAAEPPPWDERHHLCDSQNELKPPQQRQYFSRPQSLPELRSDISRTEGFERFWREGQGFGTWEGQGLQGRRLAGFRWARRRKAVAGWDSGRLKKGRVSWQKGCGSTESPGVRSCDQIHTFEPKEVGTLQTCAADVCGA